MTLGAVLRKNNSSFCALAWITALVYIAQFLLCRRSHVSNDIADILAFQFLLVVNIGRPTKHGRMAATLGNGFIKQVIIGSIQKISVDDGRSGFTLSKFSMTPGAKEMVA